MIPNLTILYVDDPQASAGFYAALLGREPVEQSAGFAMFVFPGGIKLGLWARDTVKPAPSGGPGLMELAIPLESAARVDQVCDDLAADGHKILQHPTSMEFGRTFMIADPDGHRVRLYHPQV